MACIVLWVLGAWFTLRTPTILFVPFPCICVLSLYACVGYPLSLRRAMRVLLSVLNFSFVVLVVWMVLVGVRWWVGFRYGDGGCGVLCWV